LSRLIRATISVFFAPCPVLLSLYLFHLTRLNLINGDADGAVMLCCVHLQAAHYIGRGCCVVLCIQNVSYSSIVDTETVTATVFLPFYSTYFIFILTLTVLSSDSCEARDDGVVVASAGSHAKLQMFCFCKCFASDS